LNGIESSQGKETRIPAGLSGQTETRFDLDDHGLIGR
jgi:hypothetical protein